MVIPDGYEAFAGLASIFEDLELSAFITDGRCCEICPFLSSTTCFIFETNSLLQDFNEFLYHSLNDILAITLS